MIRVAKKQKDTVVKEAKKEPVFSKSQLISSKKYEKDRDVLMVVLEDKNYTEKEVLQAIDEFKKGKVK